MRKWRYSIGMKAAAAAAAQAFAVLFVICLMILVVLFQKNILDFSEKRIRPLSRPVILPISLEERYGNCWNL